MRIKSGDFVEVIAGDDSGVRGKVLRVNRDTEKVIVEGVNRVYKHVRRSQRNPQGGRLSKEMGVPVSNVVLVCPLCDKNTKVAYSYAADGSKERVCKECEKPISKVSPPRQAYAMSGSEKSKK